MIEADRSPAKYAVKNHIAGWADVAEIELPGSELHHWLNQLVAKLRPPGVMEGGSIGSAGAVAEPLPGTAEVMGGGSTAEAVIEPLPEAPKVNFLTAIISE